MVNPFSAVVFIRAGSGCVEIRVDFAMRADSQNVGFDNPMMDFSNANSGETFIDIAHPVV